MTQFGLAGNSFASQFDDRVAFLDSRFTGRRFGLDSNNLRRKIIEIARGQRDPKSTGVEILSFFHRLQVRHEVSQRYGKTDSGVVPFRAVRLSALRMRCQRSQHAIGSAMNVNKRATIIGRRNLCICLNCFAPNPVGSANNAYTLISEFA